jgi:O-antigen ligase
MRAVRDLPLAAPLVLAGLAVFFGGGPLDGPVAWLGGGALATLLLLAATRGIPGGFLSVVPLVLLASWCAISISWSWLPDRSWDYANRAFLYALFAALGLWFAGRARLLAGGLAVIVFAVCGWSLLGKVLPPIYDYGGFDVTARLTGPVGLWNQLALIAVFGLVLALVFRRTPGALLAYVAGVTVFLTYSRGGLLTAAIVLTVWLVVSDERIDGGTLLVAAGLPAAVTVGIAFLLPGVTADHQPSSTRWHDGLVFGVIIAGGAAAAVALERRLPRPADTPRLRRAAVVVAVAALVAAGVVLIVHGFGSGAVGNGQDRLTSTSSNFRFTWWEQAWRGFRGHALLGTGAGSFELLNKLYRTIYLDTTIEPHDLPIQFLAETGLVGLALLILACAVLLRGSLHRRGPELGLALLLPAYLIHGLVDIDWDFVAVSAPAFLAAGSLVGRPPRARLQGFGLVAAAGCALCIFATFLLPWLGGRWSSDALAASPQRAISLANRAQSVDPLLVEPYWSKAYAADQLGQTQQAFDLFVTAVRRQPRNPLTWRMAGEYAFEKGCYYEAYRYLERYTELDPNNRASEGADDYRTALARVNRHAYRC